MLDIWSQKEAPPAPKGQDPLVSPQHQDVARPGLPPPGVHSSTSYPSPIGTVPDLTDLHVGDADGSVGSEPGRELVPPP